MVLLVLTDHLAAFRAVGVAHFFCLLAIVFKSKSYFTSNHMFMGLCVNC